MKKILLPFTLCLSVLFPSCKNEETSDELTLSADKAVEVTSLDDYIKDVKIVKLKGDYIGNSTKILLTSDGYIVDGSDMVKFDKEGNPLCKIGTSGRGPGEIFQFSDYCLNFDKTEVLMLANHNQILRYSVSDGSFIGQIDTGIKGISGQALFPVSNDAVAVYFPNPSEPDLGNFDKEFNCVKVVNYEGTVIAETAPRTDFNIEMGFRPVCLQNKDNSYTLSFGPTSGYFYTAKNGTVVPEGKIDLGPDALPDRFVIHGDDDPWMYVGDALESKYLICPSCVCVTDDVSYFSAFENSAVWNFAFDKNRKKGIKWQSIGDDVFPMSPVASDEDCLVYIYSETGITSSSDTQDILKKYLIDKCGLVLSDEDNPAIVKVKFKI